MKNVFFAFLSLFVVEMSIAQELSGRVVDAKNGEGIPFASVYLPEVQLGVLTDSTGRFNIVASIPDEVTVRISSQFYKSKLIKAKRDSILLVELESSHLEIDEVVVIMPSGVMQRDNTVRVDRIDLKELTAIPTSNLSEAIANLNGVQQASMGTGISKPVIRGMQGVRVLTVLNGMRVENQQWGGDHGMGISQLGIGAVEVIKGPSSLLYGADAFGGVLYLVDEKFANNGQFEANVQSKFNSVNLGTTNSAMFKMSSGNVRFSVAGLYSNFADFQMPNGKFLQMSRYLDQGIKVRLGVNKNNWSMQLRYMFSDSYIGIPGHSHDSIPHPEDFMLDVQSRQTSIPAQSIQNHFVSMDNTFFMKNMKLEIKLGYTNNNLAEFEEKFTIPGLDMRLSNSLYHVKSNFNLGKGWKLIAGVQGMYQMNGNDAGAEEKLIPDFNQLDNGAYAIAFWNRGSPFSAQFGGRYDMRVLNSGDYKANYGSPNFSAGARYSWSVGAEKNIIRMNVSSGFRAPHVSELLVDGVHHGALRYEVGNPNLKSERATQFDLDYEFEKEHISFVINPFYNFIQNYTQIESQDSLVEGMPLYHYTQVDRSQLYGVDAGIHYHPHFAHWLHFESSYSLIYGASLSGNNISLMPQPRLNNLVKLNFKEDGKFVLSQVVIQHQYFFDQTKIAQHETTTSGYHLLNCGLNFKWNMKNPLEIGLGVKNALNSEYINHLSRLKNIGVFEPGRNFYLRVNYTMTGKLKKKEKNNNKQ